MVEGRKSKVSRVEKRALFAWRFGCLGSASVCEWGEEGNGGKGGKWESGGREERREERKERREKREERREKREERTPEQKKKTPYCIPTPSPSIYPIYLPHLSICCTYRIFMSMERME